MIMLFDGVCPLCCASVAFILRYEASSLIQFCPVQSVTGQRLLQDWGFDPQQVNTFVVIENNQAYSRSSAALRVARQLRWPWRTLGITVLLPRPLRDALYNFVATHRYRVFGKKDTCMVPAPEVLKRFILQ